MLPLLDLLLLKVSTSMLLVAMANMQVVSSSSSLVNSSTANNRGNKVKVNTVNKVNKDNMANKADNKASMVNNKVKANSTVNSKEDSSMDNLRLTSRMGLREANLKLSLLKVAEGESVFKLFSKTSKLVFKM